MFRANTVYEGEYLLGTSIARPLIAKRLIEIARREKLMAYADKHGIPGEFQKRKGPAPFSMDANLFHTSYQGGVPEDPNAAPPEKAPSKAKTLELESAKGDLVAINGKK